MDRRGLRPFLKWVGGKRQLLPVLRNSFPPRFGHYHEPFVGSGAVFFDLLNRGALNGATLSDDNADLIGCYRRVVDALDAVLASLDGLAAGHAAGGREHYLRVRDERFNPMRSQWRRDAGEDLDRYPSELAAMLIYLNRTGYNGLYRVNASGEYNVPPGRYERPTIVNRPLLALASRALSAPNTLLKHAPFDRVLEDAREGDFVYFDPPYAPLTATANFRGYTGRMFSIADQRRLQQTVITLARRGVFVVLSNSTSPEMLELYEHNDEARAAGLRISRVPARRSVNSRPDRRGAIDELIVSNVNGRA